MLEKEKEPMERGETIWEKGKGLLITGKIARASLRKEKEPFLVVSEDGKCVEMDSRKFKGIRSR